MRNDTCSGTDVSVFPVQRPGQSVDPEDAEIRQFSNVAVTLLLFRTRLHFFRRASLLIG
jgi:hypothetical protein